MGGSGLRSGESCLQEALAGSNEGELSTRAVRLSLASSDTLHQQWNLLCHSLRVKCHEYHVLEPLFSLLPTPTCLLETYLTALHQ